MTASPAAMAMIRHFESLLEVDEETGLVHAYRDPVGIPTIGWGTIRYPDSRKVKMGDVISQDEADEYLLHEVDEKVDGLSELIDVEVSESQFGALVSFAYNVGLGAFKKSTLRRKLNQGDHWGAANEFRRWNKAGGRELKGLTRRRLSERNLFCGFPNPIIVSL